MARPPIRRNEELALDVAQLAENGDGLARVGEFPVFVAGALAEERVRAKVVAVHESHGRAELLAIERASPDRAAPRCRHYGRCAFCRYQHVVDDARVAQKLERLRSALHRHLGRAMPELAPISHGAAYGARCRIALRVERRHGMQIGLLDRGGSVFHLEECPATDPRAAAVAQAIAAEALTRELPALRAIAVHAAGDGKHVQATLVADTARLPHAQRLADVARAAGATGICLNQHDGREDRMFGRRTTALLGRPFLVETVGALKIRVSATTFFEATHHGATAMAAAVAQAAAVARGDPVVDLYSGSGSFALALAHAGARVVGVETNRQAVHDAEGSAHDLEITGVRFIVARTEQQVLELERYRPAVVVADPPGTGLTEEVAVGIARILTPSRVVLVGRDPGTLGRDAARFVATGYRAAGVAPVDTDPLSREIGAVITLVREQA